jgi:hypothetical protein
MSWNGSVMKAEEPSEALHHDAFARQRNLVYPDTVCNEAAGYRYLLSASKLRRVERLGALIVGLLYSLLGAGVAFASFLLPRLVAGFADSRIVGAMTIPLALVMFGIGFVFAMLGLRLMKRAIRT